MPGMHLSSLSMPGRGSGIKKALGQLAGSLILAGYSS
jgi:hypothetical protein